jgi:hypothetical protein
MERSAENGYAESFFRDSRWRSLRVYQEIHSLAA